MTDVKEPGLRERKRSATRTAIERAAIALSLERGFAKITVDEISDAAGVSPRTFFNYFPSKEAAVIGHAPDMPSQERIDAFVGAGPQQSILEGIRGLLADSIDEKSIDEVREVFEMRRKLMLDNPHLFTLRLGTMEQMENSVTDIVSRRLAKDDPLLAADAEALRARASLVVYVSFAGMRHAWSCWAARGGSGLLSESIRESFDQLQELSAAVA